MISNHVLTARSLRPNRGLLSSFKMHHTTPIECLWKIPQASSHFRQAALKGAYAETSQAAYSHSQSSLSSASTSGQSSGGTTLQVLHLSHCTHWSVAATPLAWTTPSSGVPSVPSAGASCSKRLTLSHALAIHLL